MAKQRTVSQVILQVLIRTSLNTTFVHISFVQGPRSSSEPCHKWFFKSSYHFHAYRFRSKPMVKQRTVSQVVLQVFILFSCISVPFKAHGQATNRVISGSSNLHTTLVRISSVQGPWPSSELCRKWFFKSSYHSRVYQFHSRPIASSEPCRKWFFKSSYHFSAYRFRSRPMAKQRTVL